MSSERYAPMLAKPLPEGFSPQPGQYVAEEKFDGHRLLVRVGDSIESWSRTGKDSNRKLSTRMLAELRKQPYGVYDGELVSKGGHSSDVARLENHNALEYVIFDCLERDKVSTGKCTYNMRREFLWELRTSELIKVAPAFDLPSRKTLDELVEKIWAEKGEGVIVKHRHALYRPGKRSDAFLKLKKCLSAVLTIVGWESGTTGPYCVARLVDDMGEHETGVKVLDDATRVRVNGSPDSFIGRRLRIEYHERTPDGSYRHPRWDRLEDE